MDGHKTDQKCKYERQKVYAFPSHKSQQKQQQQQQRQQKKRKHKTYKKEEEAHKQNPWQTTKLLPAPQLSRPLQAPQAAQAQADCVGLPPHTLCDTMRRATRKFWDIKF